MFIEDRKHNTIIWMEIFHEYYLYNYKYSNTFICTFLRIC